MSDRQMCINMSIVVLVVCWIAYGLVIALGLSVAALAWSLLCVSL